MKSVSRVEKNYGTSLQPGLMTQEPMFPEWQKNIADRAKFDKLVHILEKHEARDPKQDLAFLKTEVLSKWKALSHEFYHMSNYVHDYLNDADLTELAKVVTYKHYAMGE